MADLTNLVKGGVGDSAVPENFDPTQVSLGIQIEMEHTNDPNVAKEIAMDHLSEDPEYYSKLVKAGLADEFKPLHNSGFGDPDTPSNDSSRLGTDVVCTPGNNVVGKIGDTSNGQVLGRRSDPILNKTVDIELEEKKGKKKPSPTNPSLWSACKAWAKRTFDVYPSAYANAAAAKRYKSKGGKWKMREVMEDNEKQKKHDMELVNWLTKRINKSLPGDHKYGIDRLIKLRNQLRDKYKNESIQGVAFDGPFPAEVSPDGQGTSLSGYDYVGYAENINKESKKTMTKQQLKETIKSLVLEVMSEQEDVSSMSPSPIGGGETSSELPPSTEPQAPEAEEAEEVTITLDRETAQKLHDLLMAQLESGEEEGEEGEEGESTKEAPSAGGEISEEHDPICPACGMDKQNPSDKYCRDCSGGESGGHYDDEGYSDSSEDERYLQEAKKKAGKKKWIQKAVQKPGALHKQLGIPADKTIPMSTLKAAAKKAGKLGQRARLALTLRKVNKKKGN